MKQEDIKDRIKSLFDEAAGYRKKFESKWKKCEDYYDGNQWKTNERKPVTNIVFSLVEHEVPVIVDGMPSVDLLPYESERQDDAKILESAMHYVFDDQDLSLKQAIGVKESLISQGFMYVDFDPDQDKGEGRITIRNIPWRYVWLDPNANEIQECRHAHVHVPVKVDELKRRFPKFADEIEEESIDMDFVTTVEGEGQSRDTFNFNSDASEGDSKLKSMAWQKETWLRDYTMMKVPQEESTIEISKEHIEFMNEDAPDVGKFEDHKFHIEEHSAFKAIAVAEALQIPVEAVTEQDMETIRQDERMNLILTLIDDHLEAHNTYLEVNPKGEKPKYPNNLRLVIEVSDQIVYDGQPDVDDGLIPLVPFICYKKLGPYSKGEVENIISPQESYNEMNYLELQNLRLNSNSGFVVDEESGVDAETLSNEPGIVIKKKMGTEVQRLSPGQVSPQYAARKVSDRFDSEFISGINEASQGRKPSGITAAKAVEYLQMQTNTRIRLKIRYLEAYTMPLLAKLVVSRIVKYWTSERKLRIYDNNGAIKYVNFDPTKVQNLRYEIKTAPSSLAGMDKESLYMFHLQLLQLGVIDAKTFIESVEIPNKTKILESIQQKDEQAAMVQQLLMENEQMKAVLSQIPMEGTAPVQQP